MKKLPHLILLALLAWSCNPASNDDLILRYTHAVQHGQLNRAERILQKIDRQSLNKDQETALLLATNKANNDTLSQLVATSPLSTSDTILTEDYLDRTNQE